MIYTVSNQTDIDWNVKGNERIVQNVCNLLKTMTNEVPFLRKMGIDPDVIDNQNELKISVQEQIEEYEPRANVLSVAIGETKEDGDIEIQVEIEV